MTDRPPSPTPICNQPVDTGLRGPSLTSLYTNTTPYLSTTAKMDNSNRFHLNLNPNNGVRPEFNDRAYPTTPSTFPNPIFPSQAPGASQGQGETTQQPYSTGFAPQGYFMNNPYPPTYPQQPPATSYGQAAQTAQAPQAPAAPSAAYQNRGPQYHPNDATNGLVHQFSHQNLGGRVSPYGTRQAASSSGGQRPRTAGTPNQQGAHHASHLGSMSSQSPQQQNWPEFQPCPSERNPDKYGRSAETNQTKCSGLAETFFKDSVKRARDRNVRLVIP
jgi:protein-serine/threonine kinase